MDAKRPFLMLALLVLALVLGGCTGPATPGASNSSLTPLANGSAVSNAPVSNASAPVSGFNATPNPQLNQSFYPPEQCLFDQAGLLCDHPSITTDGRLSANLTDGDKYTIRIMAIACVHGRELPAADVQAWPAYTQVLKTLKYTEVVDLGGFRDDSGKMFSTQCTDITINESSDTGALPNQPRLQLEPNQDFSGRLYVAYSYADDPPGLPPKINSAIVVVRVR